MFKKFADFIVKHHWYVIGFWIVAAVLTVTLSPRLDSVTSDDQASFLPSKYESATAQKLAAEAFPQNEGQTVISLIKRTDGKKLTSDDQQKIQSLTTAITDKKINKVNGSVTSPQMLSKDGKIQLITTQVTAEMSDVNAADPVKDIRNVLSDGTKDSDLEYAVTGSLAIMLDTKDSSQNAEIVVGLVTVLLILILPTIVFRSPFAGILSLVSVGIVFTMATSLLALTAKIFDFNVSGQLTSLLIVVLFGIGTDYILFLLFRYRERLRSGDHTRGAVAYALGRASEAIFSAALVVASAFAAMFAASLGFFSSLAPGLVISVLLMLAATMTLVPALLSLVGDKIFWPSKKWQKAHKGKTISARLGAVIARRPGVVSVVVLVLLAGLASGLAQYKSTFDLISQLPSNTESSRGYKDLSAAFSAGTSSPVSVYIKSDKPLDTKELQPLVSKLATADGVDSLVAVQAKPTAAELEQLAKLPPEQLQAMMAAAAAQKPNYVQLSSDKKVALVSLLLKDDPNSDAAMKAVGGPIRDAAHSVNLGEASVYVGGETASYADLNDATNRDISVIAPVAAVIIFVILAILLRSLVAPIYLLLSVGLGILATLGATTYLFMGVAGHDGLMFMLPILLYLFVVAVGTDYNILMITRLREEIHIEGKKPREAARLAVEHTAPTLASAGLILAGTFASLMLAGMSLLTEMGFSVSFGIALGAFVVSMFLIPALSTIFGKWVWWPSKVK